MWTSSLHKPVRPNFCKKELKRVLEKSKLVDFVTVFWNFCYFFLKTILPHLNFNQNNRVHKFYLHRNGGSFIEKTCYILKDVQFVKFCSFPKFCIIGHCSRKLPWQIWGFETTLKSRLMDRLRFKWSRSHEFEEKTRLREKATTLFNFILSSFVRTGNLYLTYTIG